MLIYLKLFYILPWLQLLGFHPAAPASAVDFGAISDGKKVILNWVAGNDRSFDYFTIERSKDGVNFVSAVMIKGSGKITSLVDYTDIDYSPFSGISYYRLKQTDYSGESSYSGIITVNGQINKDGVIEAYTGQLPAPEELKEMENKAHLVFLKNAKGEEFISKVHITADQEHLYGSDDKHLLSNGSYVVVASSCNRLCSQRLIVR